MRTTVSGCVWLLMIGLSVACSSKSTGGGGGSILGGSGGSSTGGSSTSGNNGGTATSTGGSSTATGGTSAQGGSGGTGGSADLCAGKPIMCVNATTASGCDPVTGMTTTTDCVNDATALGFVSSGCKSDAQLGDGCTIDSFSDPDCEGGTVPFAACNGFTQDDLVDVYVACFQDTNSLKAVIQCYAKYYDETANTLDCVGASTECDAL